MKSCCEILFVVAVFTRNLTFARRISLDTINLALDEGTSLAETESKSGGGDGESAEIWIRAECEVPARLFGAKGRSGGLFSKTKELKDTCYYLKAYEDQDVLPEESRTTLIKPIFQGATEGRYAEKDPLEEDDAPWRLKFARLIPGEIEFEEFPETWEFELYGDVVRPTGVDGNTHCKDPELLEAKDRLGALAITGEQLKKFMKEKVMPKVHLTKVEPASNAVKRFSGTVPDISEIACVFDFNEVQFENYMQSKAFGANFEFSLSVDFTGSNTAKGPGEFIGASGNVQILRSQPLHHLADRNTLQMLEDPTDWTDAADDPYNQYIMPIKRAVKTLSEYTSKDGADMAIFGGKLTGSPWVRTDGDTAPSGGEELIGLPANPGKQINGTGEMPFAHLQQPLPGKGDDLARGVVTTYIDAVRQCQNSRCWASPTHILPSIYWEVRKILLKFKAEMQSSSDPVVATKASSLTATDLVLDGASESAELKAHVKNEECKDHTYHVLAIFTDGDWDDREQRRVQNFIGQFASKLPLSIILVGVGEGDADDSCEYCVEEQHGFFKIVDSGDNCVCPPGGYSKSIKVSTTRSHRGWTTRSNYRCDGSENGRLRALESSGGQAHMATVNDGHTECSLFPRLEELDGDVGTAWYFMNWASDTKPSRDIIQSVIMKGDLEDASKKISSEILSEIPDQMEDYFKNFCHLSPLGQNVETTLQEIERLYKESMAEAQEDWKKYEAMKQQALDLHVQEAFAAGTDPDPRELDAYKQAHGIQTAAQLDAEKAKAKELDTASIDSKLDLLSGMLDVKSTQAEKEQETANFADGGKEWTAGITPPLLVPELDSAADMCPPHYKLVRDTTGQMGDICRTDQGGGDARCILKACQETTVGIDVQRKPQRTRIRRGDIADGMFKISEALDDSDLMEKILEMKSEGVIAADGVRTKLESIKRQVEEMTPAAYEPEHDGRILVTRSVRCITEGRSFQHDGADALCKAPAVVDVGKGSDTKEKSGRKSEVNSIVKGGEPYSGTRKGKGENVQDDLLDLL